MENLQNSIPIVPNKLIPNYTVSGRSCFQQTRVTDNLGK
jgi:hypothetical protein